MSDEFKLFPFPQEGREGEVEEPKSSKSDQSTIALVARGYRRFWKKRGMKPPAVSHHWIQLPEEWD